MSNVKLEAKRSWVGQEGDVRRGDMVMVTEDRAKELKESGRAINAAIENGEFESTESEEKQMKDDDKETKGGKSAPQTKGVTSESIETKRKPGRPKKSDQGTE